MLSGNRANPIKNSAGRDDKNHTIVFRLDDISNNPNVKLTRGGFILIGLMSGGDYHQAGLPGCGPKTAHALAKCGFGDSLYEAALTNPRRDLLNFLKDWREDLRHELRTNSQGHLGRKYVALAKNVPDSFPDIDILLSYTNPITSETESSARNLLSITWDREPDLGRLANICELYFEWGVKPIILKRFRTVIWPSAVLRVLRRQVLERDRATRESPPSTPKKSRKETVVGSPSKTMMSRFSKLQLGAVGSDDEDDARLFVKIHSSRTHASTDGILEYRLEIDPGPLVRLCEAGIAGIRPPIREDEWADDDDGDDEKEGKDNKTSTNPLQSLRVWMPASMVQIAEPELVMEFDSAQEKKAARKAKKDVRKTKASESAPIEDVLHDQCSPNVKCTTRKTKSVRRKPQSLKQLAVSDDEPCSRGDRSSSPPPLNDKDIKSFFAVSKQVDSKTHTVGGKAKSRVVASRPKFNASNSKTLEFSETPVPTDVPPASSRASVQGEKHSLSRPCVKPVSSNLQHSDVLNIPRPQARRVPKKSRKNSQVNSDSDSYESQLKKSPRKSTQHDSPRRRKSYSSGESDDDKSGSRPISPSPLPNRTKKLGEVVIEISSESDDLFTALDARPLLIARARKAKEQLRTGSRTLAACSNVGKVHSRDQSVTVGGVIDLT